MAPSKAQDEPEGTLNDPHHPGLLAAFLEGRLDLREREVMTGHLAGCAECRQALALLARAAHAGLIPRPAPAARPGPTLRRWQPLAAAAVLVVAVATVTRLSWPPAPAGETAPSPPPGVSRPPPPSPDEAAPAPSSPPAGAVPRADALDPGVLVTRGGVRRVAGKTFRLAAGEWTDASFDPAAGLPITEAHGPDQRSSLLSRVPALAPYAALGERVLVVLDGTVYRFGP